MLSRDLPGRVLLIEDASGSGKTTVLRRLAYQLSKRGVVTLNCSSLSRLEPSATVAAFDLIDVPVVVIVDNFADQAQAVNNIVELTRKRNLVFVGAERSYRHNHIQRSFGSSAVKSIDGLELTTTEAGQLVDAYDKRGALVNSLARSDRKGFLSRISKEPIAMACCHILNDMRPIDSIVDSVMADVSEIERNRFYVAALARVCFPGGLKYEVLSAASSRANWDAQFDPRHPAPLSFFEGGRDYVVPLNVTLAERALERAPREVLLRIFGRLATAIAPRVNRESIKRRVPEAKIAGRLFDYDDIIKKYLGDKSEQFYESARQAWRWNSRYWEQLSLFYLSRYRATKSEEQLDAAVQHARHAVSIERHAFSLTTLAKVLLTQANDRPLPDEGAYSEAVTFLVEAIGIERNRGRASVHAYVTLFRGSVAFIQNGGEMSEDNYRQVSRLLVDAREFFSGDRELRTLREELEAAI
jgi:nucleoside-triphosphatase THEP1